MRDSVVTIDEEAFSNCAPLRSVVIGKGVTAIKHGAFTWCTSLKDVYYKGTESAWANITIDDSYYLTHCAWGG